MSNNIKIATTEEIDQQEMYERILLEIPKAKGIMQFAKACKHRYQETMGLNMFSENQNHVGAFVRGQIDLCDRIIDLENIAKSELEKIKSASAKEGKKLQKTEKALKAVK